MQLFGFLEKNCIDCGKKEWVLSIYTEILYEPTVLSCGNCGRIEYVRIGEFSEFISIKQYYENIIKDMESICFGKLIYSKKIKELKSRIERLRK